MPKKVKQETLNGRLFILNRMKYVISERQYGLLIEQSAVLSQFYDKNTENWARENPHAAMTITALATSFLPGVGLYIASGIGFAEAKMFYDEGDKTTAALTAVFSILPLIGSIVLKIPGVKQLGTKGMAALASKLKSGGQLTKTELEVADGIAKNSKLIESEVKSLSSKLSPNIKQIEKLKPKYIKRFGQQSYDNQLGKFLKNEINVDEFINTLSSGKKTGLVQGVKGVVMSADEISKITDMAQKVANGQKTNGILKIKVGDSVEDVLVNFVNVNDDTIASAGLTSDWGKKLTLNVKNLPKNVEDIKRVIYHEITHMKDPAPQFMKQNTKTGKYYVSGSGTQFADEASELMNKAKQIQQNTPKGQKLPKEYYDLKNRAEKLFSKYEYSPSERLANNQMIFNSIPDKINSVIKNYSSRYGKKKAVEVLNSILTFLKGGGGNIDDVIGARQVEYINNLKKVDLKKYNDLIKKIFQEVENVKAQL